MGSVSEVLQEIHQAILQGDQAAHDTIRRKYLAVLNNQTGRNVIAYYSGFLSKPDIDSEIGDADKHGFMGVIHGLDRSRGLDLIIHTPGGNIAATQSLVDYLRKMFDKNIRAIVPQIAMSAGTMLAFSCKEIIMGKHSNLGPFDPLLRGVQARAVIQEFRRAFKEVKRDRSRLELWQTIIGKYNPTFLAQCEQAVKWSDSFVCEQLAKVMFDGERHAMKKARSIVRKLTSFTQNRTHGRHIHMEELASLGIKVNPLEGDQALQEAVLTVHHAYMHTLMNTRSCKIVENHLGVALIRNVAPIAIQGVPGLGMP